MKKLIAFISNSSLFISLMAVCLSSFYSKILLIPIDMNRSIVIFCGTLLSYIGVQLIPLSKNLISNERNQWINDNRILLIIFMVLSIIGIILYTHKLNSFDVLYFSHLFILVVFYEKILTKKNELRKVPYLKPFIIAYIWAWVCTAPTIYLNFDSISFWPWIECFIFILALTIPFDIRDLKSDSLESIKTIPIKLGVNKSRFFCTFLFFISVVLQFKYLELNIINIIITVVLCASYIFLIKNSWPSQNDKYFLYGFDGLMAFKLLYLLAI
jgi:4-hydroxybenzoate polyprenyltransferase